MNRFCFVYDDLLLKLTMLCTICYAGLPQKAWDHAMECIAWSFRYGLVYLELKLVGHHVEFCSCCNGFRIYVEMYVVKLKICMYVI